MSAVADGTGHVAILGAGPIGLDAALAFVDNGWSATVYEAADSVAANVTAWSHIRMFTPWPMNVSERMLSHLHAAGITPPGATDRCPTGGEFVEQLLRPLARLPELAATIRSSTRVLGIAREGLLKHEEIGTPRRGSHPFRCSCPARTVPNGWSTQIWYWIAPAATARPTFSVTAGSRLLANCGWLT